MRPVVRRAERGDAVAIATVHVASWKAGYRGVLPDDYLDVLVPEDRIPFWEEVLDDDAAEVFTAFVVLDDNNVLAGFVTLRPPEVVGVTPLGALYVDPNQWSRGFGGQLLDTVAELARARGDTEVWLWVHPENHRARAWYERRGWTDTGIEEIAASWGLEMPERRYRLVVG